MAFCPDLKDLNIWIAGGAKSGISAAKKLHNSGAKVFVSDNGPLTKTNKDELLNLGISFEENGHSFERFANEAQMMVTSPAIPMGIGLAKIAALNNILIVSEIEVAHWFRPPNQKWIGVTGTNGKSTTTAYLAQLLLPRFPKTYACGNIGLPVTQVVDHAQILVIELSSYQLETTFNAVFDATIFLNLQEDHLLRYKAMDPYFKAKWRLVQMTSNSGSVTMPIEIAQMALKKGLSWPRCKVNTFVADHTIEPEKLIQSNNHTTSPLKLTRKNLFAQINNPNLTTSLYGDHIETLSYFFSNQTKFKINHEINKGTKVERSENDNWKALWSAPNPIIPGSHNALNITAASIVAYEQFEFSAEQIEHQWSLSTSSFAQLPHRLEKCPSKLIDIEFINDSKATNLESLQVALKSFSGNVILLLGGEPKGEDFAKISLFLGQPIKKCFAFGKARTQIEIDLGSHFKAKLDCSSPNMLDAARAALDFVSPGDVILLSPGCASFDEFKNFEHRGDTFREWVRSLTLN